MTEKIEFAQDCTVKVGDDLSLEEKANNYKVTMGILKDAEFTKNLFIAIDVYEKDANQLLEGVSMLPKIASVTNSAFNELMQHIENGGHIEGITKESLLEDKREIDTVIAPKLQEACSRLNEVASKYLLLSKMLLDVAESSITSKGVNHGK